MNSVALTPQTVNPLALDIGQLIGLFTANGDGTFDLNTGWFNDPWSYISAIPSDPKLFEIVATLIGGDSGNALGTPKQFQDRVWYPILNPLSLDDEGNPQPTGVYLVSSVPVEDTATEMGFGGLYNWEVEEVGMQIIPYTYLPVILLPATPADSFEFILGNENHPVECGIEIQGASGTFSTGVEGAGISFDGFKVGSNVYFSGQLPSLDLTFLNLILPGEQVGVNRSLFDLIENTSIQEWITMGLTVLGGQLSQMEGAAGTAGKMINSILALLGLVGPVPGIDWEAIVNDPASIPMIFTDWLSNIAADPEVLRSWLNDWFSLFKGEEPTNASSNVKGMGLRSDPFSVELLELEISESLTVNFDFTFATTKADDNSITLFPGFAITTTPFIPISSMPEFGVKVNAAAEFLSYLVPKNLLEDPVVLDFFPKYSLMVSAANTDESKPLFSVEETASVVDLAEGETATFSIGTIETGFTYSSKPEENSSLVPTPNFKLVDVQSVLGAWPVIDLANFGTDTIGDIASQVVSNAIRNFFGEDNPFAEAFTATLGVDPPSTYTGEWPLQDEMLLSGDELELLIQNPFNAWGAYYARTLSNTGEGGEKLFSYLVPQIAVLLGGNATEASGTGTVDDPWKIKVIELGTASLFLEAWQPNESNDLAIAFAFELPLPFSSVDAGFQVRADMLVLGLPEPDGSGQWGAAWMQAVTGKLFLKGLEEEPLTTPSLAGVQLSVNEVNVNGGWKNDTNFFVQAGIEDVKMIAGGAEIELGNLVFSSIEWDVTQLEQFSPAIVSGMGLLLLQNGGRVGVSLAAIMGLLPNLPDIIDGSAGTDYDFPVPEGITLPEDWPLLVIQDFANPWNDLIKQFSALFEGGSATMEPAMQLLGWAISDSVQALPTPLPSGSLQDPWTVLLPNFGAIELVSFLVDDTQTGFGLQKRFSNAVVSGIEMNTYIRADVPGFFLSGADSSTSLVPPAFSLINTFANPDSNLPLLDTTAVAIGSIQFGFYAYLEGGNLEMAPLFRFLNSRVGDTDPTTYELTQVEGKPQFTSPEGINLFDTLIHAMMDEFTRLLQTEAFKELKAFLDLLNLLGLVDVVIGDEENNTDTQYSFNQGGWNSILANPLGFLFGRLIEVLSDDQTVGPFIEQLAVLLGYESFDLPPTWQGVQYLLNALGLTQEYNGYFVPVFQSWLDLILQPLDFLSDQVGALFTDSTKIETLVTALNTILPDENEYFTVDTSSLIATVHIPTEDIVNLGDELRLFASLIIDLKALSMTAKVSLGSETLLSAIAFAYTPTFANGAFDQVYGFYLEGIPDGPPAPFEPLQIWPFPEDTEAYLKRIGFEIPMSLLSSFGAQYINNYVVPQNPAVGKIFEVLGLTFADDDQLEEANSLVRPFLGIFMNPVEWMLSKEAIGDGSGGIDLGKLGQLLYAIADAGNVSSGDVQLLPYEHEGLQDGVKLTGLPWGVEFILYSNSTSGVSLGGTFAPGFSNPLPDINLSASLAFGKGNGLSIAGDLALAYTFGEGGDGNPVTLGIESAYEKSNFSLTAMATSGGSTITLPLLPFTGFNQFLTGDNLGAVLQIVGDQMFSAYNKYIADNPSSALKPFVESIETLTGITDGQSLFNFFNAIYQDPLGQFTSENIVQTLSNIHEFVSNILKIEGFELVSDGKVLEYLQKIPALPNASIAFQVGLKEVGEQEVFGLFLEPTAVFEWISLSVSNAGVGIQMPADLTNPEIAFSVDLGIATDLSSLGIPGLPNPSLELQFAGTLTEVQSPNLVFYPIQKSTDDNTLVIELLPNAELVIVGRSDATPTDWMINFGVQFLVPFVANMALNLEAVKGWLDNTTIGDVEGVPGKVLVAWELLGTQDGNYYLNNLQEVFDLSNFDPIAVVTKLIFSALDLLDGKRVVPIKDGGVYVTSMEDDAGTRYGIRVQIQDILVSDKLSNDGAQLLVQLGKYFGNQTKEDNWTGLDIEPGIQALFINKPSDGTQPISFDPRFDLVSVGLDFAGANDQKPLVNINGVTVASVQPRALVTLDFQGNLSTDFGAGIMVQGIGIPLGPGFLDSGGNSNPVAQNLVSSGGNPDETDAVNPSFSVSASYVVNSQHFQLDLYDGNGMETEQIWIPIMRAFGPIQCRKIGIGWHDGPQILDFLFDGAVSLAGLTVDLVELGIGIPITDPTNFNGYTLDLAGLNISFDAGAASISGGFLKDDSLGYIQYIGQGQIKTPTFGIGAFGAYALIDNAPSMFIFAYLNAPLGGPPFFFLNGLSGGFGYNRTINIPPVDQIENFPFVAGIKNPTALGGTATEPPSNESALQALGTTIVPPELGSYWLAAGVAFSSFKLIDANAVVMVIFGNDFEIALTGLAGMVLPKTGRTYVGAQIGFKVTYKASTGLLAMEAVLTSNSYVIDPNCRLTGGLAFYVWFKNQADTGASAGEFVFSLGGYNENWQKPDYYPDVPRLGLSWSMPELNVSIKGEAYFALTPSAVMAGGRLEAVYKSGGLKAWFKAYADFLIMWNPFHFDIRIGVTVGASYTVKVIWTTTFKVELGADLHLWGPATAGSVRVSWWVISFTVKFGANNSSPDDGRIITWSEFDGYFLPEPETPAPPPQQMPVDPNSAGAKQASSRSFATEKVQQVTHINQLDGLIKELNVDGATTWQVRSEGFAFAVSTQFPLNKLTFNSQEGNEVDPIISEVAFGIKPMGSVVFGSEGKMSTLSLSILYNDAPANLQNWTFSQDLNGIPESMWGTVNSGMTSPSAEIIPNALVGLDRIEVIPSELPAGPPKFSIENLGYLPFPWRLLTLQNDPWLHPTEPVEQTDTSIEVISNTVMEASVVSVRTSVLNAIVSAGINVQVDGRLDQLAAYAPSILQSFPLLGQLGSLGQGPGIPPVARRIDLYKVDATLNSDLEDEILPPEMIGAMVQYSLGELNSQFFMAPTPGTTKMTYPIGGMSVDSFYSPESIAIVSSMLAQSNEEETITTVQPGVSQLWNPNGNFDISVEGEVPVWIAEVDTHNQPLGYRLLAEGESEINPDSSVVIFSGDVPGEDSNDPQYATGWHISLQMILVNTNVLLGTNCLILPDGPVRKQYQMQTVGNLGLLQGSIMSENNRLQGTAGENPAAGFETAFPTEILTVIVLVQRDNRFSNSADIEIEDRVQLQQVQLSSRGPIYVDLCLEGTKVGLNETAYFYSLPILEEQNFQAVYAVPEAGYLVSGTMGSKLEFSEAMANWDNITLKPPVPQNLPQLEIQSHITITQSIQP